MKPSPFCYIEIPSPDIEIADRFYSSVFHWKINPSELSEYNYRMFSTGEEQLMGGLDPQKPVRDGGIIMYIKVDDINKTLDMIKEFGGNTILKKEDIGGGFGFSATFRDPNGNHLGLWSNK